MTIKQDFDFIQINLVSPKRIKEWGQRQLKNGELIGEVTKTDTINYRTFKPEMDGLFCEKIFGPVKNWECYCGKNKGIKPKELLICERCNVEVTESRVRRHRMGYIKLISPVTHVWYLKGIPSYISLLLNYRLIILEEIVYFNQSITINKPNNKSIENNFDIESYYLKNENIDFDNQSVKSGGSAIKYLLQNLDLEKELIRNRLALSLLENGFEISEIFERTNKQSLQTLEKLTRRIRLIENFISTGSEPNWMILDLIPVIPPGLRPMVQLEGGRFATSDLNELYKCVITRNNRLGRLVKMLAPDIVLNNEKRLIQEAIDTLIDNGKRGQKILDIHNRPLKSLADIIGGKHGRFRQNLLGKRVDYSARSVIIVGPSLKLNQCGLPHEIALKLFQPFIIHQLMKNGLATNMRVAKKLIQQGDTIIWKILKSILQEHPILLNRAPTLHRLGIQAFEAVLIPGRAIHLHPLVCTAFNADFDGDQMAIHLPLSSNAKNEAKIRMLAYNNFLSPANGDPIIVPTQDMVLGCYYLTVNNLSTNFYVNHYFSSYDDAILAYTQQKINLNTPIWINNNKFELFQDNFSSEIQTTNFTSEQYIRTTPGRIILNLSILKNLHL
jgi:DNA-directed RNA polymerase subunit beta'